MTLEGMRATVLSLGCLRVSSLDGGASGHSYLRAYAPLSPPRPNPCSEGLSNGSHCMENWVYTPKGCHWWHPNQCGSPYPCVYVSSNVSNGTKMGRLEGGGLGMGDEEQGLGDLFAWVRNSVFGFTVFLSVGAALAVE